MALNPPRHWDFLLLGWSLSFGTPGQISVGAYNTDSRSAKYQANTRLRARFLFVLTNLKTLKRRLGG